MGQARKTKNPKGNRRNIAKRLKTIKSNFEVIKKLETPKEI